MKNVNEFQREQKYISLMLLIVGILLHIVMGGIISTTIGLNHIF